MHFTKIILIALCIICGTSILNAATDLVNPLNAKIQTDESGVAQSFSYVIKGKDIGNGQYTLDKIVKVKRLSLDQYINKCVVVKVKSSVKSSGDGNVLASNDISRVLNKLNGTLKPMFKTSKDAQLLSADEKELSRIYEIHYTAEVHPFDACLELINSNDIEYVNPRYIRKLRSFTPNDPQLDKQWAVSELDMPDAWAISKGSKSVKIGIVDSGVNWYHEDLSDNIWSNPNETINGIDDDGNGKIDDIRGWDFVGTTTAQELNNGTYHEDNDPDNTVNDHGTYVSGCASAVTNNGIGVAGFGYGCTLIPVKCGSELQGADGIYTGYEGMKYAADLGADIINCSWGGTGYDASEEESFNYCLNKGALIVIASGNAGSDIDDTPDYPASFAGALAVGATEKDHIVADYSNYGYTTTIFAPGSGILSTSPNNTYNSEDGTSFASPITSGIAGLIKALHPTWTAKQIWHQIRGTAKNNLVTDQTQRPKYWGLIDPVAALTVNNGKDNPTMPGIGVNTTTIQGASALTDTTSKAFTINIKNYLSASKNLKVTLKPLDDFVELSQTSYDIGILAENNAYNLSTNIKLTSMTPWYEGYARIEATYTDDNYVNVELIQVPIEIKTANSFAAAGWSSMFSSLYMAWKGANAYDYNGGALGIAYSPISYYYYTPGSYFVKYTSANDAPGFGKISSDTATAACMISSNTYCVGTSPSNGQAAVYYSTNSGQQWASTSVSTITSAIKDIHFFDSQNGIFIGNQKSSLWGIATTSNAAQQWITVNGLPTPLLYEEVSNASVAWNGNSGWFGTSAGRVFFTKDKGQTWDTSSIQAAKEVKFIAFADTLKGIALFNEAIGSHSYKVAASIDGGKTWNIQNKAFTSDEYMPIKAFSLTNSAYVYVVFSDGRILSTKDQGLNWVPVLTQRLVGLQTATAAVQANNYQAKVVVFGSDIATLTFTYEPANIVKHLALVSADTLIFPSTAKGQTNYAYLKLKNDGNSTVTYNDFSFASVTPNYSNEFSLGVTPSASISYGITQSIKLNFTPQRIGDIYYTFTVKSDATNSVINVVLKGTGTEPSSVNTVISDFDVSIVPNPVGTLSQIVGNNDKDANFRFSVYSISGDKVLDIYNGYLKQGSYRFDLSSDALVSGVYFLRIDSDRGRMVKQFIVNK